MNTLRLQVKLEDLIADGFSSFVKVLDEIGLGVMLQILNNFHRGEIGTIDGRAEIEFIYYSGEDAQYFMRYLGRKVVVILNKIANLP